MVARTTAIIGQGYVGLPLTLLASRKGHRVIGIDSDANKVRKLGMRQMPFEDSELEPQLSSAETVHFTTDYAALREANDIIICVPTPVRKDTTPDLSPVESAARSVAKYLDPDQLVVLESTVNPGVTEGIVGKIIEQETGMRHGKHYHLAHCPERINPGDTKWPAEKISRVAGASDEMGLERTLGLYESLLDIGTHFVDGKEYAVNVHPMGSIEEAELVKMLEKTMSDLVIAGVSQVAPLCNKRGIDLYRVIQGMETKHFSFFRKYPRPGTGVGGHCIPVDPWYLIHQGDQEGVPMDLYRAARRVNDGMPAYTASLVMDGLNEIERSLRKSVVTVLGLSYKENVDDVRDTPAFPLIDHLHRKGALVRAYDPHVSISKVPHEYQDKLAPTLSEAISNSHSVVVATAHNEFREQLSGRYLAEHNVRVAVDGRNCLSSKECAEYNIIFKAVGRVPQDQEVRYVDLMRRYALRGNNGQH